MIYDVFCDIYEVFCDIYDGYCDGCDVFYDENDVLYRLSRPRSRTLPWYVFRCGEYVSTFSRQKQKMLTSQIFPAKNVDISDFFPAKNKKNVDISFFSRQKC